MNTCNSLGLTSFRKQKFGGLEKMEEEESADKHQKDHETNDNIKISPTHILGSRAALYSWFRDITRVKRRITCIFAVGEKAPGHYRPLSRKVTKSR